MWTGTWRMTGRRLLFAVDKEKAAFHGISTDTVTETVRTVLKGSVAGLAHVARDKEPVEILVRAPLPERAGLARLRHIPLVSASGQPVSLAELVKVEEVNQDKTIYRKNLRRVVYVIGDVAGPRRVRSTRFSRCEGDREAEAAGGLRSCQYSSVQPWLEDRYAMKWDGEWHITYEVFRDLGIAFAPSSSSSMSWWWVVSQSFWDTPCHPCSYPPLPHRDPPGHAVMGAFFHCHLHDRLYSQERGSWSGIPSSWSILWT